MPKELVTPSHKANLPKFGHDMTKIVKFSSNVGQLLPVYYDVLQPGDKIRFNVEMFSQITDIVSPAMMHVEESVDWFFVPFKQLNQFAPQNLFKIDDSHTSYKPTLSSGSVFPMMTESMLFSTVGSSFVSDLNISDFDNELDEYGIPIAFNHVRLAKLLGYGDSMLKGPDLANTIAYNVFLLQAYQKIFYDCYRITDRTPNNVIAYNTDRENTAITNDIHEDLLKLHYSPWKRDFFTSVQVSPLIDVGDIGMQSGYSWSSNSLTQFNNWLSQGVASNNDGQLVANAKKDLSVSSYNSASGASLFPMNTALLRGMFAAEKIMEITRRAAKRYDAQVLAHFGYEVPNGVADEVYRLGSDKAVVQVNEVTATATSSAGDLSSTLGQRGGKAAAYGQNKNKSFVAPAHGVLMAIYRAVPDADYGDSGVDRFNTFVNRYDYYQPEYERLGMQPLFRFQAGTSADHNFDIEGIGWQWRYMEYKMKYNQCYGAFNYKFDYWTVKRSISSYIALDSLSADFFYVPPTAIDNVLLLSAAYEDTDEVNSPGVVFARDAFLHWFKFNVFKSSCISNYSLPSL